MVVRITRLLLLAQLALVFLIACFTHVQLGTGSISSAFIGVGAITLIRMGVAANNFAMAWHFGSETPPEI